MKQTVLVVDDAPANIDVVVGILGEMYEIRVATDGHRALAIAGSSSPPDLILLDIMMPGTDGYEVYRHAHYAHGAHKPSPGARDRHTGA